MNTRRVRLLVVAAGPFQVPLIERGRSLGLEVIAVDGDPNAPGLAVADIGLVEDIMDVGRVEEIACGYEVDGITSVACEPAVLTVAAVASRVGLVGSSTAAARTATDKERMRRAFGDHGVASVRWLSVTDPLAAEDAAQELGLPVVVKPVDSSGSRGVQLVRHQADVRDACVRALRESKRGAALVEEFVPGPEYAVEALVDESEPWILTTSKKVRSAPPALLDLAVLFPADDDPALIENIESTAVRAIRACGITNSAVHFECIVGPHGPTAVEVAARGAGFHVFTAIVPYVTEIDTMSELIGLALGRSLRRRTPARRGCALVFPTCSPGVVKSIEGFEQARGEPGVLMAEPLVAVGAEVAALNSGSQRTSFIIAGGADAVAARKAAAKAESLIIIDTEAADDAPE